MPASRPMGSLRVCPSPPRQLQQPALRQAAADRPAGSHNRVPTDLGRAGDRRPTHRPVRKAQLHNSRSRRVRRRRHPGVAAEAPLPAAVLQVECAAVECRHLKGRWRHCGLRSALRGGGDRVRHALVAAESLPGAKRVASHSDKWPSSGWMAACVRRMGREGGGDRHRRRLERVAPEPTAVSTAAHLHQHHVPPQRCP